MRNQEIINFGQICEKPEKNFIDFVKFRAASIFGDGWLNSVFLLSSINEFRVNMIDRSASTIDDNDDQSGGN